MAPNADNSKERTMVSKTKPIPFSLSRSDKMSLTNQAAEGFRSAIASGYYRRGDLLPPLTAMASSLGVSLIVARGALKRLADEGLVLPHPGVGSEVLGPETPMWLGRVLFVVPDRNDSYQVNVVGDILRRRLLAARYFFSQITVVRGREGLYDLHQLEQRLKDPGLMVVQMFGVPEVARAVSAAGARSVVVARDSSLDYGKSNVVRFSSDTCIPALVERCLAAGVKKVLQIGFEYGFADASHALAEAGVSVETVYVPAPNMEEGLIASVKGATIGFFKRYFACGMPLPDLIYFTDDHAAEAGLLYLAVAGVEVPDDVRVVAWSNKGLAPVYVKDVSRLEMDPYANGERLSDYVLALLRGDDAPVRPELAAAFVDGETFPQNLGSTKTKQKSKRG